MRDGKGIHDTYVPGTFRPLANKDNDYLMDRAAQKRGDTYSGVEGIAMQDASLQESMGPIVDRTKENLVSTDNGIIMARHRLLRALKAMEKGETPPGIALRASALPLGRGGAAAGPAVQGRRQGSAGGADRQGARDGLIMQSESARMSSAAEARFRIDAPNSQPRAVKVIALDQPSERVVKTLAQRQWNRATFFTASAFGGAPKAGRELRRLAVSDLAGRTKNLIEEVNSADLVVMVAAAGESAQRRLDHRRGLQPQARDDHRRSSSAAPTSPTRRCRKTLSQLRPWALMLVIASAEEYVEDMLRALRA